MAEDDWGRDVSGDFFSNGCWDFRFRILKHEEVLDTGIDDYGVDIWVVLHKTGDVGGESGNVAEVEAGGF